MGIKITGIERTIRDIKNKHNGLIKDHEVAITKRVITALKASTPVDTGNARDGWKKNLMGDIINDVEYISDLNRGSSAQAPEFFIEKTILAQKGISAKGTIVTYNQS